MSCELLGVPFGGGNTQIVSLRTVGNAGFQTFSRDLDHTVNLATRAYVLRIDHPLGSWGGDNTVAMGAVVIEWTLE